MQTAGSAQEALELVQRLRPELVVSDIGMPGEDGYELIRRVRGRPADEGGGVQRSPSPRSRGGRSPGALRAGYDRHLASRSTPPSCSPRWRTMLGPGPFALPTAELPGATGATSYVSLEMDGSVLHRLEARPFWVVGHRGSPMVEVENTLPSFRPGGGRGGEWARARL